MRMFEIRLLWGIVLMLELMLVRVLNILCPSRVRPNASGRGWRTRMYGEKSIGVITHFEHIIDAFLGEASGKAVRSWLES